MVTRQELMSRSSRVLGARERLMRATPASQIAARAATAIYNQKVAQQQQQISQEISERQSRINQLAEALKYRYSQRVKQTGVHYLDKKEVAKYEKELARLQGETKYLSEASKIVQGGTAINVSDFDAESSKYATSTPEYQQAKYSEQKVKARASAQQKSTKEIMKEYGVSMLEAQKIKKTPEIITITDLPARELGETYITEQVVPSPPAIKVKSFWSQLTTAIKNAPQNVLDIVTGKTKDVTYEVTGYGKAGKFAKDVAITYGLSKPYTEIRKVTEYNYGIVSVPATEEEKKYYIEQVKLQQKPKEEYKSTYALSKPFLEQINPKQAAINFWNIISGKTKGVTYEVKQTPFFTKLKEAYEEQPGQISGLTSVASETAGEAWGRILEVTNQGTPETRGKGVKVVKIGAKVTPYLIPGFGQALFFAEATEEKFLSAKAKERRKERARYYEQQLGWNKQMASELAEAPSTLKFGLALVATQAYLAKNPLITKGKQVRKTFLVRESARTSAAGAESRFRIVQQTTRNIIIQKRGLIVMPEVISNKLTGVGLTKLNILGKRFTIQSPISMITKTRYDTLQTIGNIAYKKGDAYGFVLGKRTGAKIGKVYELRGTVSPVGKIETLPKIQQDLFKRGLGISGGEGQYALGQVELRYLGKLKKISGGYSFVPAKQTGKNIFGSYIGGKSDVVKTLGMGDGKNYIEVTIPEQNKFIFTNVAGKRITAGLPRTGGKIFDLDILTKVKETKKLSPFSSWIVGTRKKIQAGIFTITKAEDTGIKIFAPAKITKTPFWKTFQTQAEQVIFPSEVPISAGTTITTGTVSPAIQTSTAMKTALISAGTRIAIPSAQIQYPIPKGDVLNLFGAAKLLELPKISQFSFIKPETITTTKTIISEITKPEEITTTASSLKQAEVLKIEPIQKPIEIFKPSQQLKEKLNILPKIFESYGRPSRLRMKELFGYGKAYKVLVKRLGKYQPLQGAYSKAKATKIGESIALRTLVASFKIEPTRGYIPIEVSGREYIPSPKIFRTYKIKKGKRIPLVNEWIQKRGMRLGMKSEVREIISKRIKGRKLKIL